MLIYDDIYTWEGWGGAFRLGSGRCRLRIYDLKKGAQKRLAYLKSILIIATDLPRGKPGDMTVKSCNSHIATSVARDFNFEPNRMQFVEYYPARRYGKAGEHLIEERIEAVDFTWYEDKAMKPVYRDLDPPLLDIVRNLLGHPPPPPAA